MTSFSQFIITTVKHRGGERVAADAEKMTARAMAAIVRSEACEQPIVIDEIGHACLSGRVCESQH